MVYPALAPEAYTVGWITILSEEFNAARDMLDEEHEMIYRPPDPYPYAPGIINGHCVVIARTGEAGPEAAANCAARMQASFPGIKFGLLVGIGGGVPSAKHDIRLGDVVVSKHSNGGYGGVVAYVGTHLHDDGVKYHRHLDRPPPSVAHAIDFMESDWDRGDRTILKYLSEMKSRHYATTEGLVDVLYSDHDLNARVDRKPRPGDNGPRIHYGLIASGPWVVKTSGSKRADLLRRIQGDVLCFEMEAAGLMNTFPCLVVRGISDYCDSHKNDHKDAWHKYASATAACYAKWLLHFMSPRRVLETPWSAPGRDEQARHTDIRTILRPSYFDIDRDLREKSRCLETGDWILREEAFRRWQMYGDHATLFLYGIPGSGKTFLMLRLLEYHRNLFFSGNRSLTYFFCDGKGNDRNKQTAVGVMRCLIAQILRQMRIRHASKVPKILEGFEDFAKTPLGDISLENLLAVFISCLQLFDENYILIDALDECAERTMLLDCLQQAREKTGKRFLAILSSQDIAAVPYKVEKTMSPVFSVRVDSSSQRADVERYIDWRMKSIDARHLGTGQQASDSLKSNSNGYFLLAQVSCNALQNDVPLQIANPRKRVDRFPKELTEYFQRTLRSLSGAQKKLARDFYSWVAFAKVPLTPEQITVAMNVASHLGGVQADAVHESTLDRVYMGLIEVENGKLEFGHAKISQFVLSHLWEDSPMSSLAKQEASFHTTIALVCIEHLSAADTLKISGSLEANDDQITSKLPLWEYASQNWMEHVTASKLDEPILKRTRLFLESHAGLIWWIRYMNRREFDDWWTQPRFAGLVRKWFSGSGIVPNPSASLLVRLGEKRLEWIASVRLDDDRLHEASAALQLASHHDYNDNTREASKVLDRVLAIVGDSKVPKLCEIKATAMSFLASIQESEGFREKAVRMCNDAMNLLTTCGSANTRLLYDLKRKHAEIRKSLGFFEEARRVQEENLRVAEKAPYDPYTLGIRNALGLSCLDCEDLDTAEELLARHHFIRALGADHPSTMTGLSNLAEVYKRQGKIKMAHGMLEEVFQKRKEMSGPTASTTLMAALDVANTCAYLGRLAQCRELRMYVKQHFDEVERSENDRFSLVTHLANADVLDGNFDAAHKRLADYLAKLNQIHGSTHNWTLHIKMELASVMSRQGRLADADSQRKAVLERQRKSLGENHPWTLSTEIIISESSVSQDGLDARAKRQESCLERLSSFRDFHVLKRSFQARLANTKYEQGLLPEAEALQNKLCSEWRRSGDDWCRELLLEEIDLAYTKSRRGHYRDAEALVSSVLQRRLAMGDADWPLIRSTRGVLAFVYDGHGKLQQGNIERKAILEDLEKRSEDPVAILDAKEAYAKSLARLGYLHEALKCHEQVLVARQRLPQSTASTTAHCLENVALTKWYMERYGEVMELMNQVIDIRRDVDGERSAAFLMSKQNKAIVLREMGELEQSEAALREVWETWKELAGAHSSKTVEVQAALVATLRKMNRESEANSLNQLVADQMGPRSKVQVLESKASHAEQLAKDGNLSQAVVEEVALLQEWRELCDEDSIHVLDRMRAFADRQSSNGNLEAAQQTLEKLLEKLRPAFNLRGPFALDVKTSLGEVLAERNNLERAAEVQIDVLDSLLDFAVMENHKTQWARWRLAQTRYKQERYEEAEQLQAIVKDFFEQLQPRNESSLREASLDYSRILCEMGRFEDVQSCLASLLQREDDKTQRDYPEYEKIMIEIGETYLKESKLDLSKPDQRVSSEKARKAQVMFEKVMKLCQDRGELQSEPYRDAQSSLAIAHYRQNQFGLAEDLMTQTLHAKREMHGEDSTQVLDTILALASIKRSLGKTDDVAELLEAQLHVYENNDTESSQDCINVLSNLASLHFEGERFDKATEFQKRLLTSLNGKQPCPDRSEVLVETKFLSRMTWKLRRAGETHVLLQRALQMHKDDGEELSEASLDTQSFQAMVYYEEEQLEAAEKIEQHVVDQRAGLVDTRGKEQLATAVRALVFTKARLGRMEEVGRLLDWDIELKGGAVEELSEAEFAGYLELLSTLASFSLDGDDYKTAQWYQDRVLNACLARDRNEVSDEQLAAARSLAVLNLRNKDDKAQVHLEKLLELYERRGEGSTEECLQTLGALSVSYFNSDDYEKADRVEERIVNARKMTKQSEPELLISALASQVKTKEKLNDPEGMVVLLKQQISLHTETSTIDSEQGREALTSLANAQFALGDFVGAEVPQRLLVRSLSAEEEGSHSRLPVALEELVVILATNKNYEEAHATKAEQLRLLREHGHTGTSTYTRALAAQADLYVKQHNAGEAEPILQEVLDETRKLEGPDAAEGLLVALTRLAGAKISLERLEEAEPLCEELVVLHEARGEDGEEDRADVLVYLATIHNNLGHSQQFLECTTKVVEAWRRQTPPDKDKLCAALQNLALAHVGLGQHCEALPVYEEIAQMYREHGLEDAGDYLELLEVLARVCDALERTGAAQEYRQQAEQIKAKSAEKKAAPVAWAPQRKDSGGAITYFLNDIIGGVDNIFILDEQESQWV